MLSLLLTWYHVQQIITKLLPIRFINDELTLMSISALAIMIVMMSQLPVPVHCLLQELYHLDFINGRCYSRTKGSNHSRKYVSNNFYIY